MKLKPTESLLPVNEHDLSKHAILPILSRVFHLSSLSAHSLLCQHYSSECGIVLEYPDYIILTTPEHMRSFPETAHG